MKEQHQKGKIDIHYDEWQLIIIEQNEKNKEINYDKHFIGGAFLIEFDTLV